MYRNDLSTKQHKEFVSNLVLLGAEIIQNQNYFTGTNGHEITFALVKQRWRLNQSTDNYIVVYMYRGGYWNHWN